MFHSQIAVERKVTCKKSVVAPRMNDVHYEFIASDDCDESPSETTFASPNDPIFPTTVLSGSLTGHLDSTHNKGTSLSSNFESSSLRKPRSEQTVEIAPTKVLVFDPKHTTSAVAEERQNNNPNADIQDIITGIVKLLNGNVNLQANTQYPQPTPPRRFATRINNRGPPRIPEYPVVLPVENMKTTPYPSGIRKPPTVPYPFDLPPPEKPTRSEVHPVIMHNNNNNKPIQPNRPPWHGSRTRPPIQITNTNRMQMPTRLPHQPTQDFRSPSKTVNTITTYSTGLPEVIKPLEVFASEKSMPSQMLLVKPSNQPESVKEMTRKPDLNLKKSTKLPLPISSPIIENTNVPPKMPVNLQTSISPLVAREKTTETTTPVLIPQASAISDENTRMPQLIPSSTQSVQVHIVPEIKATETIESSIDSTISPSRVTKPTEQIESSTDFKSFYARPGIVLDDTDYKPGVLEPSTEPVFHHTHRDASVQSSASLSNIFAEIFDVTLSAIQGQPGSHHKVVDLIEIRNTGSDAPDVVATKYGTYGNDIIVSASDDNSFVSIDGKRTYINLFGETSETEHLKYPQKTLNDQRAHPQSTKTVNWIYSFLFAHCFRQIF